MDKIKNKSKIYKKATGGSFSTPRGKGAAATTAQPIDPQIISGDGRRPVGVGGPLPQAIDPVRPMGAGGPMPPPMAQLKKGGRVASKPKGGRVASKPKGVGVALRGFGKAMKGK